MGNKHTHLSSPESRLQLKKLDAQIAREDAFEEMNTMIDVVRAYLGAKPGGCLTSDDLTPEQRYMVTRLLASLKSSTAFQSAAVLAAVDSIGSLESLTAALEAEVLRLLVERRPVVKALAGVES